ncbi:MAG: cytochrome c-type biogenesis CcmF C-terminal domain-containing protein [Gemmatimonadaceae bacterium]
MTLVGELSLWIALLMAAWATTVSFAGGAMHRADLGASGRRAIYVAAASLLLANAGVIAALLSRDFSFAYVARHTSLALPRAYVVSALWSGTAGTLLVGALAFAALGSGAVIVWAGRSLRASSYLAGTIGVLLLMALLVLCFARDPYERLGWLAGDGLGLDPMLRHAEMVLARPAALIGVAAVGVGAGVLIGARASGAHRDRLAGLARAWFLPAWTLLTVGLALQMRGWYAYSPAGGVWQWTPFATTGLVLWVLAGVVLHLCGARAPRRRWRVGEYLSHLGAAVVVVALGALAWSNSRPLQLRTGQESRISDPLGQEWRFVSQGVSRYGTADHDVTAVALEGWRGGAPLGLIVSQRLDYRTAQGGSMPVSEPALRPGLLMDLRVAVDSTNGDLAFVQVTFAPLAGALWLGAALVVLGGLAAMLPVAAPRAATPGGAS